jgi:pyrroloquinoline quinone (PQQ) biosynthesis protein C
MSGFFFELVSRTDEGRRDFETNPVVLDAVAKGMSVERYRRFLAELYHIVFHFNPICAAAASRMGNRDQSVQHYLFDHLREEVGHDEWVLNDLEAVGADRTIVERQRPSPFTLALVGYNYWCADRAHPYSALGMVYALEVIASVYGGPFSAAMHESLLLSGDRGITFISSHATMDAVHMSQLKSVLDTIEGSEVEDAIVGSTLVNFHHFTRVFEAV